MEVKKMRGAAGHGHVLPGLFLIVCVVVWLAPFFRSGWTGRTVSWLPRWVTFQHTAAGLFTRRSTRWWDHHLEIQEASNQRSEVNERIVFPMGAFGFRTRYDRIMIEMNRSPLVQQARLRLAEHVFERLKLTAPDSPAPKALRLVRSLWDVGAPNMAAPAGWWNPPPVTGLAAENRQLLGTYQRVDGHAVEVVARPHDPVLARAGKCPCAACVSRKLQPALGSRPTQQRVPAVSTKPPPVPPATSFKRRQALEQVNRLPPPSAPNSPRPMVNGNAPQVPRPQVVLPLRLGKPGLPVVSKPEGTPQPPAAIRRIAVPAAAAPKAAAPPVSR